MREGGMSSQGHWRLPVTTIPGGEPFPRERGGWVREERTETRLSGVTGRIGECPKTLETSRAVQWRWRE